MSNLSKYLRFRVKRLRCDGDKILGLFPQEAENIASELDRLMDKNKALQKRVAELEAELAHRKDKLHGICPSILAEIDIEGAPS